MRRFLIGIVVLLVLLFAGWKLLGHLIMSGKLGQEREAGTIIGEALPASVVIAKQTADASAVPEWADPSQIMFGDFHVHTTYSTDAFMFSFPAMGGVGLHPVAEACDFARYCSGIDFWAVTDHAEGTTPLRWERAKQSIRDCQAKSSPDGQADLVSFVGFEWTQVGATPEEHYGHQNVIFRDLEDDKLAARPISAPGIVTSTLRTNFPRADTVSSLYDFKNRQIYFDFNRYLENMSERYVPMCDESLSSDELPNTCLEQAPTPGDLVRKLEEQGLDPLIIPHGSTWGFYTPAGSNWDKQIQASNRPDKHRQVEIYSGHGNSEEWRPYTNGTFDAETQTATCAEPNNNFEPLCWRLGEIIRKRCLAEDESVEECAKRAEKARNDVANMGGAGHLAVGGETPEELADAGQCKDCFQPSFNYRPNKSVQAALAQTRFDDDGNIFRFNWGFISSSDNHRARPGTGYKEIDRRKNTEAGGPISEAVRRATAPPEPAPMDANSHFLDRETLLANAGFAAAEFERASAFWLTGGLAAVHADSRSRQGVWDAFQRNEIYATSGPRMLLWFDAVLNDETKLAMGSEAKTGVSPTFRAKAAAAFKQNPGCPDYAVNGLGQDNVDRLCSGECYNPTNERHKMERIEVIRIRPQAYDGEPLNDLIDDDFLVHDCGENDGTCEFEFTDPDYAALGRDTTYYVRAVQEATPTINAERIVCAERDTDGTCLMAKPLCYGDYRSGDSECLAPSEHRAWSSPIFLIYADNDMEPIETPAIIEARDTASEEG